MKLISILFVSLFSISLPAQTLRSSSTHKIETNQYQIPYLMIVNHEFERILDSVVLEYKKCDSFTLRYPWIISVQKDCIDDREDMYCISICQSMFFDATEEGYGCFYHRGLLFVVKGVLDQKLFRKTQKKKKLLFYNYSIYSAFFFDPPRWIFVYDDECFFEIEKEPCGG